MIHKIKIDLLKIPGARLVAGKDGRNYVAIDTKAGGVFAGAKCVYLDLDMRENRDGLDQHKNTHWIAITPTQEQRMAKERTPIVGNAKTLTFGDSKPETKPIPPQNDDDEIDF